MTRFIVFFACMAVTALAPRVSFAQDTDWPEPSGVIEVSPTDAKVEAAKVAAIESLPRILAKLENLPSGWSDVSFKVDFLHGDNNSEFMWVSFLEREKGTFKGLLANDPKYVDYAAFGDLVEFEKDQIIDWQYSKNGKLHGHYTTRALLDEMGPQIRSQMLAILSETPE